MPSREINKLRCLGTLTTTLIRTIWRQNEENSSSRCFWITTQYKWAARARRRETIKEPKVSACSRSKSESDWSLSWIVNRDFGSAQKKFSTDLSLLLYWFRKPRSQGFRADNSNHSRRAGERRTLEGEIRRGLMCDWRQCRCEINKNTFRSPSVATAPKLLAFRVEISGEGCERKTSNGSKSEILIFITNASHQN